jgi:pyruvate formate-lyase activating enzyme-like uncharacterized protein
MSLWIRIATTGCRGWRQSQVPAMTQAARTNYNILSIRFVNNIIISFTNINQLMCGKMNKMRIYNNVFKWKPKEDDIHIEIKEEDSIDTYRLKKLYVNKNDAVDIIHFRANL